MIASTQTINTKVFAFIAALVFKLLGRKVLSEKTVEQNKQQKLLKSKLLFKKIENFTGKLLPNYKQLECEVFRILLIYISNQCFSSLHDCTLLRKFLGKNFDFVRHYLGYVVATTLINDNQRQMGKMSSESLPVFWNLLSIERAFCLNSHILIASMIPYN